MEEKKARWLLIAEAALMKKEGNRHGRMPFHAEKALPLV
jgi:hypothetical protein